jgi:flagellar M-ring protein FliF
VLLVLLLAVRPLIGKLKGKGEAATPALPAPADDAPLGELAMAEAAADEPAGDDPDTPLGDLPRQVELARRLAAQQPERAVEALQRMLEAPETPQPEAKAA